MPHIHGFVLHVYFVTWKLTKLDRKKIHCPFSHILYTFYAYSLLTEPSQTPARQICLVFEHNVIVLRWDKQDLLVFKLWPHLSMSTIHILGEQNLMVCFSLCCCEPCWHLCSFNPIVTLLQSLLSKICFVYCRNSFRSHIMPFLHMKIHILVYKILTL